MYPETVNGSHIVTGLATAAIARGLAVKFGSTDAKTIKFTQSGADEEFVGTALGDAATGEPVAVALSGPLVQMIASAAIAIGVPCKATAAGKLVTSATDRENAGGVAATVAGADGDVIWFMLGYHERSTA
jgi:hypothetical protein